MAIDNIAVVNTSMVSTSLLKEPGFAISKFTDSSKEFSFAPSSILSNQINQKYVVKESISTFVDSNVNNSFFLKNQTIFSSDAYSSIWSNFSSKTAYSQTTEIKIPQFELRTITKNTEVRDCSCVSGNISFRGRVSLVRSYENRKLETLLKPVETICTSFNSSFKFNEGYVFIDDDTNTTGFFTGSKLNASSIQVEDYRPINIGGQSKGSGLKSIVIVAQKMSFFEMALSFTTGRVVSVSSLPSGMYYEQGKIKGSPISSGYYPILIQLDNASVIEGVIIVPHVPRQL